MVINQEDIKRLAESGWQSWSYKTSFPFKFPILNFNPKSNSKFIPKNKIVKNKKPAYGWCSWYAYGWDINEEKITKQSDWIAKNNKFPLDYILIDGGWCKWGDWLKVDKTKFPHGLKEIAKKIKSKKQKPGIWIAPFLVDPDSEIAKSHPEWLVKSNDKFVDGLKILPFGPKITKRWIFDIKNPDVQKYLRKSISYLLDDCKFELLKLDFLYGIYFDPNKSSYETDKFLHDFLAEIKNKYPNVYTIGCGCPLVPAVGVVDSMRIGPDTSISPFVKFISIPLFSRWYLNNKVISTINNRIWTKKFWNIDPDAFMCRGTLGLSSKQLLSFQKTITVGNGNIFLGDDLAKLSQKRLRKYILPLFAK